MQEVARSSSKAAQHCRHSLVNQQTNETDQTLQQLKQLNDSTCHSTHPTHIDWNSLLLSTNRINRRKDGEENAFLLLLSRLTQSPTKTTT